MLKNTPLISLLLFIMSAIGQACSPFAGPVNEEKSDSYYYSKLKKEIRYSPMGNWFSLGNSKLDSADVETFEVLGRDFGKDKNHVFYKAYQIDDEVHKESFHVKDHLCFDRYKVYIPYYYVPSHLSENKPENQHLMPVEGADPATFKDIDRDWAKDGTHYFYNYQIVDVDYHTFEVINENFAKDKNMVYLLKTYSLLESAIDPATARKLDERYITDKDNVYDFQEYREGVIVDSLASYPYTNVDYIFFHGEDFLVFDDKVIYDGLEVQGADARSFQVVKSYYSKDKNYVYCRNHRIEGADPKSFQVFDILYYSKDKNHVYGDGVIMPEADVETFGPVDAENSVLFKDKHHTYQWGEIVSN